MGRVRLSQVLSQVPRSRVLDPVRLAARMKRLRREFRLRGIHVDFTPINGESMA